MEREPDPDLFYTASRPKSKDDTSTPDVPEWRNSPVIKALTQKNSDGKIVCPFSACGKQYVDDAQFGKHLVRDHMKELSIFDTEKIGKGYSLGLFTSIKIPFGFNVIPQNRIRRCEKENFYYFSVQTRSKSKKLSTTDADALKKFTFSGKIPEIIMKVKYMSSFISSFFIK